MNKDVVVTYRKENGLYYYRWTENGKSIGGYAKSKRFLPEEEIEYYVATCVKDIAKYEAKKQEELRLNLKTE